MLVSLKELTNCEDYYIDDTTFQIVSFKQKKYTEGRIITPNINKNGYINYRFNVNGKRKNIKLHQIIVKMFIDPNFDSKKSEVDHKNHNKQDNSIENLCVVSKSENNRNKTKSKTGTEFNYIDDIGEKLVINEEAGIYYSLELDKFYMFINHTGKYKQLHVYLNHGKYPSIQYKYNNKQHLFSIDKFKKSLNKQ